MSLWATVQGISISKLQFEDMLPEYINMNVAESVLFAGKAVSVLRNPHPGYQSQDTVHQQQMPRLPQRLQGRGPLLDVELLEDALLPQSESDKIEAMLHDLKDSSEFHRGSFACTMDSIRTIAARHLWQLIVVRADLIGHLKALKDYFLLAKGDFFQVID
ncbi:Gamma-tubulin complex component 4 [Dionaea muscipula]